jgi:hypothetical protein
VFRCENFWGKVPVALFVVIWQNLSNVLSFYLHLMLHAYVQRFDVTIIMQKILALFAYVNRPLAAADGHTAGAAGTGG